MPTLINKGKTTMTVQDDAASWVNDSGTCQEIGTPLTHPCSTDVPARDPLRTLRGQLIKRRPSRKDNPEVHNLTNLLIGQIDAKNRDEAGPGHDVAMRDTMDQLGRMG